MNHFTMVRDFVGIKDCIFEPSSSIHHSKLSTARMSPEYEAVIKSCTTMKAIREAAERHPVLREALLD